LSAAMVGPMDGIYLLNASRVMASCRGDGKVLKPDRPVTPPDSCFRAGKPLCQVYTTHSEVKGIGRVHYYFNNDGTAPMTPSEVGLTVGSSDGAYAIYNWYSGDVSLLAETNRLEAGYEGHIYASVAPIVGGWAFLGEVDKYVVASTLRFVSVAADGGSLVVKVHGVLGENVLVCAAQVTSLKKVCQTISFHQDGVQDVVFKASGPVLDNEELLV